MCEYDSNRIRHAPFQIKDTIQNSTRWNNNQCLNEERAQGSSGTFIDQKTNILRTFTNLRIKNLISALFSLPWKAGARRQPSHYNQWSIDLSLSCVCWHIATTFLAFLFQADASQEGRVYGIFILPCSNTFQMYLNSLLLNSVQR